MTVVVPGLGFHRELEDAAALGHLRVGATGEGAEDEVEDGESRNESHRRVRCGLAALRRLPAAELIE